MKHKTIPSVSERIRGKVMKEYEKRSIPPSKYGKRMKVLVGDAYNAEWNPLTKNHSENLSVDYYVESVVQNVIQSDTLSNEYFSSLDAVSLVDSQFSDIRFDLSQNQDLDSENIIPLVGSHSSGDSILAAVTDSCVSVLVNSLSIPYLYSTILHLVSKKQACVIHVSGFELSDALTMLTDPEHNLKFIKDTGARVIFSASPQEAYDMAIIAHIEAKRTSLPVIHMFEGINGRQYQTTIRKVSNATEKLAPITSSSVQDSFFAYRSISSRTYSTFEYHGSTNASVVIVMLNQATESKEHILQSIASNPSFAVLLVRCYRPWNVSLFLQQIPPSIERIYIPENSVILADIAASVFERKSNRIIVSQYSAVREIPEFLCNEISGIAIHVFDIPWKTIQEKVSNFSNELTNPFELSLFRTTNITRSNLPEMITMVNREISSLPKEVQAVCCQQQSLQCDDILHCLQEGGILIVLSNSQSIEISKQVKETLIEKRISVVECNSVTDLMTEIVCLLLNQFHKASYTPEGINSWLESKESGSFFPVTESTAPMSLSLLSKPLQTPCNSIEDAGDRALSLTWRYLFPESYQNQNVVKPDVKNLFHVTLTKWIRLTPDSYDRNVFHMEMDISGTGLSYEIGDALGVYGENDPVQVRSFLHTYQLNPDEIIVHKCPNTNHLAYRTLEQLLIQDIDLFGRPTKRFYADLAVFATNEEQATKLEALGDGTAAEEFRERAQESVTIAEIIEEFTSARPSPLDLIRIIGPIKPRHYSIASSMNAHPNSVHLLVVDHTWVTPKGVLRRGQCTRYLQGLREGARLCVTVKPSVMKLPEDNNTPIVMAGLGTGMAPFRAFIQERVFQAEQGNSVGDMVLYFGSRSSKQEYLYGEELEAYLASGLLTHAGLAFSRDQKEKVYIQHKIGEDSVLLWDLLCEQKGHFYLCGPTWPVADVQQAISTIFETQGNFSKLRAEKQIQQMKAAERYILEVY